MQATSPQAPKRDHGGGVDGAIACFGGQRSDWIDLSTGINPVPYPIGDIPTEAWTALPDKGAQEAHEAIRPTDFEKKHLNIDYDQSRLYDLIWRRTVASQMCDAELERTQISIESESHSYIFNAKGEVITFDGFLKLYMEGVDDESEKEDSILPKVNVGDELSLVNMISTERFSRPPFRYSEA